MKPILYSYYRSTCSYRVRIALHLKNIAFEIRPIHLVKDGGQQHQEAYRELNPRAEVPLWIDEDAILSQSIAILHYLDRKVPEPELFLEGTAAFAKCIELCEMINSGIQPIQNLRVLQELQKRFEITDQQKMQWAQDWIKSGLEAFEKRLPERDGDFCLGDRVTAPDLFLIPQLYNARRFQVDLSAFPRLLKIEENALKLQAFRAASPEKQPDAE